MLMGDLAFTWADVALADAGLPTTGWPPPCACSTGCARS